MLLLGALVWPRVVLPEHLRSTHFGVVIPVAPNPTDCIRGYSYSRPPALLANLFLIWFSIALDFSPRGDEFLQIKGFSPIVMIVFLCCTAPQGASYLRT